MNRRNLLLAIAACLVCHLGSASAQQTKEAVKPVKVGQTAPDFKLNGKAKQVVALSDYRKDSKNKKTANKNVVVVFVRAHW
jgi:hypothetical protein